MVSDYFLILFQGYTDFEYLLFLSEPALAFAN